MRSEQIVIYEINFDGIVGPTHHFGGLGVGNLASQTHKGRPANPQAAALQGLDKIALLDSLGCRQAVLPPQPRPNLRWLRACGFGGSDEDVLKRAAEEDAELLSAAYSASSMWTANAATVTRRSHDGRTHFTPANLISSVHRAIETSQTTDLLRAVFGSDSFMIHDPLPAAWPLRDEGAANHMRLSDPSGAHVWDVFVHGSDAAREFPSRQSRAACQAIARQHRLALDKTIFLHQHPDAIDAGAFHNDVVATSFENILLMHEKALFGAESELERLSDSFASQTGLPLVVIEVYDTELSLADAIATYLFNSQIVRPTDQPGGPMAIVCPAQCEGHESARFVIDRILAANNPIESVHFVNLDQSMMGGGGPACLRLRVPVDDAQARHVEPSVLWSTELEQRLRDWIVTYYPTQVTLADLKEIEFAQRASDALVALRRFMPLNCLGACVS